MTAVMKNEVVEPAFPFGSANALPAERRRARDLNERELDEVAGGVAPAVVWGIGAAVGAASGASLGASAYFVSSRYNGFQTTRGGYLEASAVGATMGLAGAVSSSLYVASAAYGVRGAHVLGGSIFGASAALNAIAAAGSSGDDQ